MKIITTLAELRDVREKMSPSTVGFVPTMGFLHEGHLSLVKASTSENKFTLVSIFVNPAQFGPHEDLARYPRDFERDKTMLDKLGVDGLFFPTLNEIYPEGYGTYVEVEKLSQALCGKSRPTHFRGVTTVVLKLFNIVKPDQAYFGQKDAQQAIIIKKMTRELNMDINIRTIPIVRDADGLALSSRNCYLSPAERQSALCLSRALRRAQDETRRGCRNATLLKNILHEEINQTIKQDPSISIDYLEVVSLDRLETVATIDMHNTLVAGAIRVGQTRLIDNFILGEI